MLAQVETNGGKAKIKLNGRFDFNAHRTFRESYDSALGVSEVKEFVIDFASVDYLDSSALGMLLMLKEKAQAANKSVTLSNCQGTVKQVLDIAHFSKLFTIR